jgi:hypothetical protein
MSSSTQIVDRDHKIVEIIWHQSATPEDFDRITKEIEAFSKELGGSFEVLVDMRNVKAFQQATQAKLVEHQKALKTFGMQRAAVIVSSAIAKMQLKRTSTTSEHTTESHWENRDEALSFLKG